MRSVATSTMSADAARPIVVGSTELQAGSVSHGYGSAAEMVHTSRPSASVAVTLVVPDGSWAKVRSSGLGTAVPKRGTAASSDVMRSVDPSGKVAV